MTSLMSEVEKALKEMIPEKVEFEYPDGTQNISTMRYSRSQFLPTVKLNGVEYFSDIEKSPLVKDLRQEIRQLMGEKAVAELSSREMLAEIERLKGELDKAESRAEGLIHNNDVLHNALRIISVYLESVWAQPDIKEG